MFAMATDFKMLLYFSTNIQSEVIVEILIYVVGKPKKWLIIFCFRWNHIVMQIAPKHLLPVTLACLDVKKG